MNQNLKNIVFVFTLIATGIFLKSCKQDNTFSAPAFPEIYELAKPVLLNADTTTIFMTDFVKNVADIDTVIFDNSIFCLEAINKRMYKLIIPRLSDVPALSTMKIFAKGFCYSVILKKSRKVLKEFSIKANGQRFKKVQIAGDFNNWNPKNTSLSYQKGIWKTRIAINPGKYSYQYVLDGKWKLDPANKDSAENGMGGWNSTFSIGKLSKNENPVLSTIGYKNSEIRISNSSPLEKIIVLWQNQELPANFIKILPDQFIVEIPDIAEKMPRSFIRIWAYNKDGISNDLLIPLQNGHILMNPQKLNRTDLNAQVMYFMMVDRFLNGNKNNDNPVKDSEISPRANYMGGDIFGINKKIEDGYFKQLGISMLWLSPIQQNTEKAYKEFPEPHRKYSAYHGYWPTAITKIDNRLGTDKDFASLISNAHGQEMNVILDYVANHVHEDSKLFKEHPDWFTPLMLPDKRKNIRLWDEERLTTWFDTFLPTLDLSRPWVYEPISDSVLYWVKKFKFDGFRHDATKHVPEIFWKTLTHKLKKQILIPEHKSFYQVGETYGSRELIGSYVNSGSLDAQFDFSVYFDSRNAFSKDESSFETLKNSLFESLDYYGYNHVMGNITGNHDQSRFISLAGGGLKQNEDDKEAGWKRDVGVGDTKGYKTLSMLTAFVLSIPGMPVIYYGDEIGIPGANDPDNRRMMKFDQLTPDEISTKKFAEEFIKLRRSNMAMMYGDIKVLEASKNTLVLYRSYFSEYSIIIFNKDSKQQMITFKLPEKIEGQLPNAKFKSKISTVNEFISVEVPAYGVEVLSR